MALTVGNLVAYITVDGSQFDRGVDQAGQKFGGLQRTVMAGVRTMATGFAATSTAVVGLGAAAVKVGLDYNRMQQSSRAALTTLLGSAEAANAQMDKLDEFARSSPFAKQVFIQAQQQLIGFGVEAGKVLPILDGIQNAVAAVGGSNEDITELTRVIAQVQSSGKITAETLNQLGARGVDAATLIGSQMGKTGQQIRDDITDGALGAEEAIEALTNGMMERFGGATANIKEQFDGAADRIKGAFRDIGSVLAAPFIDPQGGGMLVVWANEVADGMRALETKMRPLVDLLVARFTPGLESISPLLQDVKGAINSWDLSQVNRQLDELGKYTPLVAGLSTAMFALGTSSLPILGAINPVAAGFAALAATSPEVRAMLGEFASSLQPLLPVLGDFSVLLADTAMLALRELTPALSDLLTAGGDLAATFGLALVPVLGDLLTNAAPLVGVLADLLGWVADLPPEVQTAALAFVALHSPIGDLVDSLSGPIRSAFSDFAESLAASKAVAEATGGQISTLQAGFEAAKGSAVGLSAALSTAFISGGITLAITGVVAALGAFFTAQAEAKRHVDDLSDSLDRQTGSLTENTRELVYNRLEQEGVVEAATRAGVSLSDLVDAAMDPASDAAQRLRERVAEANAELSRAQEDGPQNAAGIKAVADEYEDLWFVAREVTDEQHNVASAEEAARREREAGIGVTQDATGATNEYRAANEALRDELNEGIDATLSAAEAALRMDDAQRRTAEALDRRRAAEEAVTALAEDGAATDEERRNAARALETATADVERAILNEVRALEDDIAAKVRNNESHEVLYETMARGRERFIEQREQMGMTRAEAEALADSYGLIPADVSTRFALYGVDEALTAIEVLDRTLNSINGKQVSASVAIRQYGQAALATGGYADDFLPGFAGGGSPRRFNGLVHGGGSKTSDSILARFSRGEFLQNAAAVDYYTPEFMRALNQRLIPREALPGFNTGGMADELARRAFTITAPGAEFALSGVRRGADRDGRHVTYQANIHGVNVDHTERMAAEVLHGMRALERSAGYSGGHA